MSRVVAPSAIRVPISLVLMTAAITSEAQLTGGERR